MEKTLSLTLRPDSLKTFYPLFQQGVIIKTLVGCSIKDLLFRHLGITPEYLETRIQTLFLNGKAVDNPDKAFVRDGSTLALSGAMPGLVGATLRRGGTYASLRQAITLSEGEGAVPQKEGRVTLKLFNLLVPELGPLLMAKGFWIKGEDLDQCVKNQQGEFWAHWSPVLLEGKEVSAGILEKTIWAPHPEEPALIKLCLGPTPSSL
jgi:hypothetical protein